MMMIATARNMSTKSLLSLSLLSSAVVLILSAFLTLSSSFYYCSAYYSHHIVNVHYHSNSAAAIARRRSRTTAATTIQTVNDDDNSSHSRSILTSLSLHRRMMNIGNGTNNRKKKRKCVCDDNDDNDDNLSSLAEDRREALFAMIGSLWALSSSSVEPAFATFGADANMEFPDVVGGMNDRATKQCLVESLGNRECLVYKETDPEKLLYKGANSELLLQRIQLALNSLASIPAFVETKKWNDINSVLIGGPMGQLSITLNLLLKDIDDTNPSETKRTKLVKKIKEDVFAIGTALQQRQSNDILKYNQLATEDISKFLTASS